MNQTVGICVVIVGVLMGVVGARLSGSDAPASLDRGQQSPDPALVRDVAISIAEELLEEQVAAEMDSNAEEEEQIIEGLGVFTQPVEDMKSAVIRVADTLVVMEEHAQRPVKKSELDVRRITREILNPSRLGQLFATSREPGVRRDALELLERVAAEDQVALATMVSLVEDVDDGVRGAAISALSDFLSRRKNTEERINTLQQTAVDRLVSTIFFSEEEGRLKSSALRLLTSLRSQSVRPYWKERFDAYAERPIRQVTAARALKELGATGPYDQLLNAAVAGLQDSDRRVAAEAARILRSLGGEGARLALEALQKK